MRARHFIIEYDRAKTWNVHAKGIMDALFKDWSAADGIGDVRAVIKDKYGYPMSHTGYSGGEPERA